MTNLEKNFIRKPISDQIFLQLAYLQSRLGRRRLRQANKSQYWRLLCAQQHRISQVFLCRQQVTFSFNLLDFKLILTILKSFIDMYAYVSMVLRVKTVVSTLTTAKTWTKSNVAEMVANVLIKWAPMSAHVPMSIMACSAN